MTKTLMTSSTDITDNKLIEISARLMHVTDVEQLFANQTNVNKCFKLLNA